MMQIYPGSATEAQFIMTRLVARLIILICLRSSFDGIAEANLLRSPSALRRSSDSPAPSDAFFHIVRRSFGNLAIAKTAKTQAEDSAKETLVQQRRFVASKADQRAQKAYAKVSPMVPKVKSQAVKVKLYAMMSLRHAEHEQKVAMATRQLPEVAAEASKEALIGWIKADAEKAAEDSAVSPEEASASSVKKIANAIASAAEPYHMALLRNQKFAAETYAKAKKAVESSQVLETRARQLAVHANHLQSLGMGLDAQEMMGSAHSVINQANMMRQWADKLYNQAQTATVNTKRYSASEAQAAANAAGSQIINVPMKLPSKD